VNPARLEIDSKWLLDAIERLAQFGVDRAGGNSRLAYSAADLQARSWLDEQMRALGLVVKVDGARNTIASYAGTAGSRPAIAIGSHSDTVPSGGRYDGALGVLGAVAAARAIIESGTHLLHPLEVINFAAEEGTVGGGTFGSRAMAGILQQDFAASDGYGGMRTAQVLETAGLSPETVLSARRSAGELAAFLELHIEQGGILESTRTSIGVVQGIVGIRRYTLVSTGRANHAGTTAMAGRDDALVKAAPWISAVRDIAVEHGIVGTVGSVQVQPGAPTVIPGQVRMSTEIRALDAEVLNRAEAALARVSESLGCRFDRGSQKKPVICDPRLLGAVEQAARAWSYSHRHMPSGAGHDAASMAHLCPVCMIFVPSHAGVSHAPEEYTTPADCVRGAQALLSAVIAADGILG
jgi:beta-ureidopropionase / N-carbamoyl-L-amino-acid hydrolase